MLVMIPRDWERKDVGRLKRFEKGMVKEKKEKKKGKE